MKEQYDFSNAERGKFHNPTGAFQMPIYLDADIDLFIRQMAENKGLDMQQLVNQWLRHNMQLLQTVT